MLRARADSDAPNMGLQTWSHDNIRKQDVDVAKNYLGKPEIKELNRLTTILLDIFEDQLDIGKLTIMADAANLLDQQLKQLNRSVLRRGGSVKSITAKKHAHEQYGIFNEKRRALRHAEADARIAALRGQEKTISKVSKKRKKTT